MSTRFDSWRQQVRQLKKQTYALYFAYKDPRTPFFAKLFVAGVVAYAFSPIDLIPDFIPVLGYLDDLIIVPAGIALAVRMIPAEVMAESQERAAELMKSGKPTNWAGAAFIIAIWVLLAIMGIVLVIKALQK